MKLTDNAITALACEQRLTLQVPDQAYWTPGNEPTFVDYPDEWFCRLLHDRPSKQGALYLTRKGFEANREALKAAFEASRGGKFERGYNGDWSKFEAHAAEHFAKVEKGIARVRKATEKKLSEINTFVV